MARIKKPQLEAKKIIKDLNINTFPVDLKKITEHLNISLTYENFPYNISGMLVEENGQHFIALREEDHKVRQNFSWAHELGHFVLGHLNSSLNLFNNSKRAWRAQNIVGPEETAANQFAAELLMPENLVDEEIEANPNYSIKSLAEKFEVSKFAMRYRLINLGYL